VAKRAIKKRGVATTEGLETIAQRLVCLRKERGPTQAQMAKRLGVSQPVVSDYERGGLRLHGELILKVAEILDARRPMSCSDWIPKQCRRNAAQNRNWKSKWPRSPPCHEKNSSSFWQWSKPSSHSTLHNEALTLTIRFQPCLAKLDRTLDGFRLDLEFAVDLEPFY